MEKHAKAEKEKDNEKVEPKSHRESSVPSLKVGGPSEGDSGRNTLWTTAESTS